MSVTASEVSHFEPVCLKDFLMHAQNNIKPDLFTYYQSGATNEVTLAENENAFQRYLFLPRMLRDVSKRNLNTNLLQSKINHPFGIAPTAIHKIAHPEGEIATAQAAGQTGTPMILSTLSSVEMEDVAECYLKHYIGKAKAPLWFQLYVFKNRAITRDLIRRCELSGYTAIVVTIDTPLSGIRYANLRYRLALPSDIKFANLVNYIEFPDEPEDNFFGNVANYFDDSLTWTSMMSFLKATTNLPIILKGVLTVEDAKLCVKYGANGIIVSNHGARQLDSVPPTLECLSKISPHVSSNIEVYMDGGVRSGDDILKAVALGAKAVFIGRPALWALSYKGSEGVTKLINMLRKEIDVSLALNGIADINHVPKDLVIRTSEYFCK